MKPEVRSYSKLPLRYSAGAASAKNAMQSKPVAALRTGAVMNAFSVVRDFKIEIPVDREQS